MNTRQQITLRRTSDGYLEVHPKPSTDELAQYYRTNYLNNPERRSAYSYPYTSDELRHKDLVVEEILQIVNANPRAALEVGVGEGFVLAGLRQRGWDVSGIDFTHDGLAAHNPQLLSSVVVGDVFDELRRIDADRGRFDLVICNNVLEHVHDAEQLLVSMREIVTIDGWARIMVPNDDSPVQRKAIEMGYADPEFWVAYPDHLNYFSPASLTRLLTRTGWEVRELLADYPIDTFLLNPTTNYLDAPEAGRACHFARVAFELALAERSIESLVEYRRGCGRSGVGRNLIVYVQPRS